MSRGHIRPQGEGSWEIKFDLGRNPLTGRRTTKYVTFRGTKRKAQEDVRYWLSLSQIKSVRIDGAVRQAQVGLRCARRCE